MRRRDFVRKGLVVSAAGPLIPACAAGGGPTEFPSSTPGVRSFLGKIDGIGRQTAQLSPVADRLHAGGAAVTTAARRADQLITQSIRALTMTSAFRDLDGLDRAHPAVQAELAAAGPELDDTILGVTDYLEGLTQSQRAEIGERVRQEPGRIKKIIDRVDLAVRDHGGSEADRARLRRVFGELDFRLRRQPPSLLIDELTGRVRKSETSLRRRIARAAERQPQNPIIVGFLAGPVEDPDAIGAPALEETPPVMTDAEAGAPPLLNSAPPPLLGPVAPVPEPTGTTVDPFLGQRAYIRRIDGIQLVGYLRPGASGTDVIIETPAEVVVPRASIAEIRLATPEDEEQHRRRQEAWRREAQGAHDDQRRSSYYAMVTNRRADRKKRVLIGGGVTSGIGALLLGIGGITIAAGSFVGAIVMTAGGLVLLAGLITLIVGAAL